MFYQRTFLTQLAPPASVLHLQSRVRPQILAGVKRYLLVARLKPGSVALFEPQPFEQVFQPSDSRISEDLRRPVIFWFIAPWSTSVSGGVCDAVVGVAGPGKRSRNPH